MIVKKNQQTFRHVFSCVPHIFTYSWTVMVEIELNKDEVKKAWRRPTLPHSCV